MPEKRSSIPLIAAIVCALVSGVIFFRARQSPPPRPPAPEEVTETTQKAQPSATPESESEPEPQAIPAPSPAPPEGVPEPKAAIEEPQEPPLPGTVNRPSEEELLGPLPEREPDEEIAASPVLHEPIPFNVPRPPSIEISTVAQQPHLWPRFVLLRKPVRFPVVVNGKTAGSVQVPAKAAVALRRVLPDGRLEIGHQNATLTVSAATTDFLLRVKPAPTPAAATRQIVTFPDSPLNPSLNGAASSTPAPAVPNIPVH